jgi:acyl-CoA thioester hydrolase
MPATYTRSFRVRYSECDANGHLFNAHYLRFMQETAFDASAVIGYDPEKYQTMNRLWLVRYSQIEFLSPVLYNQNIEVKTWVQDFRSSSSRRMYLFSMAGSNHPVAKAHTDWVFVDRKTFKPARIPFEMQQAFFPEGVPKSFPVREHFPPLPPKPQKPYRTHRQVEWQDIDTAGMVNNPCYLDYVAECGFQAVASFKWPWKRMFEQGFAIFLRKIQIQYLQPALLGDQIELTTWVSGVKRVSATRHYEIRRIADGTLLAPVHTLGVWVDLKTNLPMRIPENMLSDFSENITGDNPDLGKTD